MLQWLIKKLGTEDYFFIVDPKNEYNETGKYELHTLNSESYVMVGFWRILRALIMDWFFKKFMY